MYQLGDQRIVRPRSRPGDLGVAFIFALCLLGGYLLMQQTTTRTTTYQDEVTPLRFSYPAAWQSADTLQDVALSVADPRTPSAFKIRLSVEQRELDPAAPPTLQTLLDRRVEQRQQLLGYHFLDEAESRVAGARAMVSEFAYVAQPIDGARRAALPVVVHAREYIVVSGTQSYYFTLAAPEDEFVAARHQLDRIIESVVLQ
jgi:hypothetical protein